MVISARAAQNQQRLFDSTFASLYPAYVAKAERKARTHEEVDQVIRWLTGYDQAGLEQAIGDERSVEEFFERAPRLNEERLLITGSVCGVKVQEVEDPLMHTIRCLDKLVDELAKGKAMDKVLRRA
ncbi:DUF2200 domain-containing protein [Corynebacterium vitaeruminis]|uniref:DUF2200 domain-containing protein n=1 Tax=Corynebacterium vitaeruminis DSM 20294 TaxID=1224164 RepID=W5Y1I0_9CORY|nr:DUF2200 domain-containing protein [Corynebacterium vitaeruminis]AHI22745.1 hypothetical protein B843_06800 [Corynebacterium vitaeruminis DSM 20294]